MPADDEAPVGELLALCPAHGATPMLDLPDLARDCGVGALSLKDERGRMGLGSFKALGAAYAIAREAALARGGDGDWADVLSDRAFVTASAGNHGLSVAAGARLFGARAIVYLSASVPHGFEDRLRAKGAEVRRTGETYEDSMAAAERAADAEGATLLSDSSWPGYTEMPHAVMEGYLQMAAEMAAQMRQAPTHILLQAGVGGMAAAVAAHARKVWGDAPTIVVVEPQAAPALIDSARAGGIVTTEGPVSSMGRLDCKTPSMIALAGLARDADTFVTIDEADAADAVRRLARMGIGTTPSGAAGLAALIHGLPDMPSDARVLAILSEGPEVG
ncbi:pyridoxal-phosphate dependent enzyme [Roseibacterium sp. SDUM158017]|uniref:pyridoxal-phosphate dependent enzyme n=1 Tax=Roseicyclus salinarum TaxID=3036773 RepID=UPI002415185A|nr:pyridoxal-phosphate dependent enzyme [Roseibacterium sp. SDUM158017]MDG4649265.1 pyridoxal-phosphate dependent enzyme [Roseibacterium sp. SDUM158017]